MDDRIEMLIPGREKSLGSFSVKRVLPYVQRRIVGPFIFWDHMGPHEFQPAFGMDVGPHPHIGLSTLTYLFEGRIQHRDSLGSELVIEPGEVNWMTAGFGIAHSERTLESDRRGIHRLHGIQLWIALPKEQEDRDPSFRNFKKNDLPKLKLGDRDCTLIAGQAAGATSPVPTYSPLFLIDIPSPTAGKFKLESGYHDQALYLAQGCAKAYGLTLEPGQMLVIKPGVALELELEAGAHAFAFGGQPFPEERHIWWNFVSSSPAKIEAAKKRWQDDQFARVIREELVGRLPLPQS